MAFFDTLSRADSFRDSIAHLFRTLATLPDILNLVLLMISYYVALLLLGDLLHGFLHTYAHLLGFIIVLVTQLSLTLVAGHSLQVGLLFHVTVLFLES